MRRGYCDPCRKTYETETCPRHPDESLLDADDEVCRRWIEEHILARLTARYERWAKVIGPLYWLLAHGLVIGGVFLVAASDHPWSWLILVPIMAVALIGILLPDVPTVHTMNALARWFTREPFVYGAYAGLFADRLAVSMVRRILVGLRMSTGDGLSNSLERFEDREADVHPADLVLGLHTVSMDDSEVARRLHVPYDGALLERGRLSVAAALHPNLLLAMATYTRNAWFFDLDWYLAWHEARRAGRPLPVAGPPVPGGREIGYMSFGARRRE